MATVMILHPYILPNGAELHPPDSRTVRDLGIHVTDHTGFSWNEHYFSMIKEAKKYAGWILRTFSSRSQMVIIPLYISFVRSRLEYSCPLWIPYTKKDIMAIEAIQRSITSKIWETSNMNYLERLEFLNLYSLQRRRERYCIIHVWKILHGYSPNDILMSFHHNSRLGPVADIPKLVSKRQHVNTLRDKSFSCNGPRLFNLIPKELKEIESLPLFKSKLDYLLKQFPDNPPTPGYVTLNNNSLLDWTTCGSLRYTGGYTTKGSATVLVKA